MSTFSFKPELTTEKFQIKIQFFMHLAFLVPKAFHTASPKDPNLKFECDHG